MKDQKFDPKNNDTHAFAKLIMSAYPHDKLVTGAEMDWALQWLRRCSLKEETNRNNDDWLVDLRTLKLRGYDTHRLDRKRAVKVSGYIWAHEGEEPNFAKLLAWLEAQDKAEQGKVSSQIKAAQKKKKLKRKQKRIGRKRRR